MTKATSAEKNRVVAERWLGIEYREEQRAYETGYYRYGQWHGTTPPNFPNNPVAADALLDALDDAGYTIQILRRGHRDWYVMVGPEDADWGRDQSCSNWREALRDAAYEAAMAERSEE